MNGVSYSQAFTLADIARMVEKSLAESEVPHSLHEGIVAYIMTGRPFGHFLTAMFSGQLFDAVARADIPNQLALVQTTQWIAWNAPAGSFGSEDFVKSWQQVGGVHGLRRAARGEVGNGPERQPH